ncbi:MAG: TrmH family RNA methyltransferase [Betaproteobacteria bacterium]
MKRWARLARESKLRRNEGRALIEGPHLVDAALTAGVELEALLVDDSAAGKDEIRRLAQRAGRRAVTLDARAFRAIAHAETPQGVAAEIRIPDAKGAREGDSVFLEGVQDAGNVGAIVRSAAAFAIARVLHDRNCADPWSPKVLRAAMGAHFALSIVPAEGPPPGKVVCAVAHGGKPLHQADLSGNLCWVFGAEGSGVSRKLEARADLRVTIPLRESAESLNVAAAAAICFYEAYRRRAADPSPNRRARGS